MWPTVFPASLVRQLYELLIEKYGNQGWWPADNSFEVIVGAILTQRTIWHNAERCIRTLREESLLSPSSLSKASLRRVAEALRPAGFYREKARYLRNMSSLVVHEFEGDLDKLLSLPKHRLREILLSVKGVGPETADSIILYAADKPEYIADAYTVRILNRIGLTKEHRYMKVVSLLKKTLPEQLETLKEFHALMVKHGKEQCKSKPICNSCLLTDICLYYKAKKVKKMYTIGYSRFKLDDLIEELKSNQVQVLIDVRRFPKSKIKEYEADHLQKRLLKEGITYFHVLELGGFRRGYEAYMESEDFRKGVEKMLAYSRGRTSCIMCMEDDPKYCHRKYIAESLYSLDLPVHHITRK